MSTDKTSSPADSAAGALEPTPFVEPTVWEEAAWDAGEDPAVHRVLGVPVSLDPRGLRERSARHYSPTDPILVPRAWGIGWDVNLGALAVRAGWAHPDDLGDDLRLGPVGMAALSLAPAALAVGAAASAAVGSRCAPVAARAAAPNRGVTSTLPTVPTALTSTVPAALVSTALGAVDLAQGAPLPQRLGHAATSLMLTGAGIAGALQARGQACRAQQAAVVAGAAAVATGLAVAATRSAIHRAMRTTTPITSSEEQS